MKKTIKSKIFSMASISLLAATAATPMLSMTSCNTKQKAEFFKVYENNQNGGFEVEFCNKGASIYGIKYDGKYITYSPKAQSDFLNDKFFHGKGLGRVAGRIADGKFTMDGHEYTGLNTNETSSTLQKGLKNNTLHGGKDGFSSQFFKHYVKDYTTYTTIAFNYVSADGEGGFPGVLDSWFVYKVYKDKPRMEINIVGIPSIKTPVDLTNHPYFRLGYKDESASAHSEHKVRDHKLEISGNEVATFRNKSTTPGEFYTDQIVDGVKGVTESGYEMFDFRINQEHKISDHFDAVKEADPVSGGIDHIWYMGDPKSTKEDDLNKIILSSDQYKLTVKTDADAVIVYTNCWPYDANNGNITMNTAAGDKVDELNGGVTVEPFTLFTKDDMSKIFHSPENPYTRKIIYEIEKLS